MAKSVIYQFPNVRWEMETSEGVRTVFCLQNKSHLNTKIKKTCTNNQWSTGLRFSWFDIESGQGLNDRMMLRNLTKFFWCGCHSLSLCREMNLSSTGNGWRRPLPLCSDASPYLTSGPQRGSRKTFEQQSFSYVCSAFFSLLLWPMCLTVGLKQKGRIQYGKYDSR